jgi:hypothetical protein
MGQYILDNIKNNKVQTQNMFEEKIENKCPGVYASRSVKPTQLCNHIRHILITSQMVLL